MNALAICPTCKRTIIVQRDRDGYGRERTDIPYRISSHVGHLWGRSCGMSGELLPASTRVTEKKL